MWKGARDDMGNRGGREREREEIEENGEREIDQKKQLSALEESKKEGRNMRQRNRQGRRE